MAPSSGIPEDVTGLLGAWRKGDTQALDRLVRLVDAELRRIVRRSRRGAAMETTSVVNDAYLRLIEAGGQRDWRDRAHFFALCARLVRGILVDHFRWQHRQKRGGGLPDLPLDEALAVGGERAPDLLAIDEALTELTQLDPRRGRVVELRFFGGMNVEEIAEVLGV